MKIGVYGGTFNPVHSGHVKLAEAYLKGLELDRMLVIPAKTPPHKRVAHLASGADRLAMCRLAFPGTEYEVSDLELNRPGEKSYTVDTLEELNRRYPGQELYLLTGSDMFLTLDQWHESQRIFQLAVMCVGEREPHLQERLKTKARELEALGARCRVIQLEPLVVSSTQVRDRVERGEPLTGLVPPQVEQYIQAHGLYGNGDTSGPF